MAKKTVVEYNKARVDSITDAFFATVMTILVLSLVVPAVYGPNLSQQLSTSLDALLPTVLSYVLSFAILGTIWVGHNTVFRYVKRVDRNMLYITMIFLLTIGFIPFSTALIGRYPTQVLAVAIYGINLIATGLTFSLFWIYAADRCFIHDSLDRKFIHRNVKLNLIGPLIYFFGVLAAFFSTEASIVLYLIPPFYYLLIGVVYAPRSAIS